MAESMQTVLSRFIDAYQYGHPLSPPQAKVCHRIGLCRTEALGGQAVHCDQCPFSQVRYHSCRNRHCPQCQKRASAQWCDARCRQVLPVPYFHLVFTLPHELNPWVQLHPEVLYALLFQAVWKTLKGFGANKRYLGGKLGMTAMLHTWGQNLSQHVHLHCLVPGGALTDEGWRQSRSHYLFPVRALSRHFRGAMVGAIRKAYDHGDLDRITEPHQVDVRLDQLMHHEWVVYTKSYLKHPETIVAYLARYSYKIAISDSRILSVNDEQVTFRWKDYRDQGKHKSMALSGEEFIRRFLLHVLPPGLMRIRHYGFLANRCRREKLFAIRTALEQPESQAGEDAVEAGLAAPGIERRCRCPKCKQGWLRIMAEVPPQRAPGGDRRCKLH